MLSVAGLNAWYGPVQILFDVSLDIMDSGVIALVGANGAGKTTFGRALAGIVRTAGSVDLNGHELVRVSAHVRAQKHGVCLIPEGRGLFQDMSVNENLAVGRHKPSKTEQEMLSDMFPTLNGRWDTRVWELSGGQQQMVALSVALLRNPALLILDEPSLGLAPAVIDDVYQNLSLLRKSGTKILLIEQSPSVAASVSDELCLIKSGRVVETVSTDDAVGVARVTDAILS